MNEVHVEEKKQKLETKYKILIGIAVIAAVIFIIVIGEIVLQGPKFVVINRDSQWNTLGTQVTYRLEVYNQGGNGWGTLHVRYIETKQHTANSTMETKEWRLHLNWHESKTLEFTFNRKSMEAVWINFDWWFT